MQNILFLSYVSFIRSISQKVCLSSVACKINVFQISCHVLLRLADKNYASHVVRILLQFIEHVILPQLSNPDSDEQSMQPHVRHQRNNMLFYYSYSPPPPPPPDPISSSLPLFTTRSPPIDFIYRRPTLYPLEIAVDFFKSP